MRKRRAHSWVNSRSVLRLYRIGELTMMVGGMVPYWGCIPNRTGGGTAGVSGSHLGITGDILWGVLLV